MTNIIKSDQHRQSSGKRTSSLSEVALYAPRNDLTIKRLTVLGPPGKEYQRDTHINTELAHPVMSAKRPVTSLWKLEACESCSKSSPSPTAFEREEPGAWIAGNQCPRLSRHARRARPSSLLFFLFRHLCNWLVPPYWEGDSNTSLIQTYFLRHTQK